MILHCILNNFYVGILMLLIALYDGHHVERSLLKIRIKEGYVGFGILGLMLLASDVPMYGINGFIGITLAVVLWVPAGYSAGLVFDLLLNKFCPDVRNNFRKSFFGKKPDSDVVQDR
jgi:hypothetical protein